MSTRRVDRLWHGLVAAQRPDDSAVVLESIDEDSPAASVGLRQGDVITAVSDKHVNRPLDVERFLLGHQAGDAVELTVERSGHPVRMKIELASMTPTDAAPVAAANDPVWEVIGLRLQAIPAKQFQQHRTRYRGGLSVLEVRPDSPASRQGIRQGDVLVGMHVWETVSLENVNYILGRPDFAQLDPIKFYILRGNETLYGHLTVANRTPR
jgi:serine protease Do